MQLIFRYGFLKLQNIPLALNHFQYGLLVLSTVLIAAAGYIINDIFDQETDYDNRPNTIIVGKSISEKKLITENFDNLIRNSLSKFWKKFFFYV